MENDALQRLRSVCLGFPEATEGAAWGHPVFRTGKKTFAAFEIVDGRPSIAFRVDRDGFDFLRTKRGFFETPYGRGLWISRWADGRIGGKGLAALLEAAYRLVAARP
ncbi:MAG TPA: MmcQ/YjbR family DNA-binding protein, partial [Thermoanaerobaculia bacterium]|nr:MmcQ/YjbR family DNA-binding protein [Thermoanaerobaculia bacterium]